MKKIFGFVLCAAIIAGTAGVSAQARERQRNENQQRQQPEQRTPEEMAKQRADRMKEQLSLDDAQYEKVLALEKERAAQMNRPGSREEWGKMTDEQKAEMREKMREATEAHNAKLKEILTEEQFTKYQETVQNGPRERRPDAK